MGNAKTNCGRRRYIKSPKRLAGLCKNYANGRFTALIESAVEAPAGASETKGEYYMFNEFMKYSGWWKPDQQNINTDRTVAWMYYCWQNPGELFWRSGMAMTISGSATNSGASIPNLNYSFSKMTVGTSEATSLEDAEHKLLDWALGQTEKGTVGIAGMAHMGPLDTCTSCQVAIQYFQNERKFILLINHPRANGPSGVYSKSLWFNRLVGKGLFPQPGLNW